MQTYIIYTIRGEAEMVQNEKGKEQVRFENRAMLHEHPVLKATNNHTSKDKK